MVFLDCKEFISCINHSFPSANSFCSSKKMGPEFKPTRECVQVQFILEGEGGIGGCKVDTHFQILGTL